MKPTGYLSDFGPDNDDSLESEFIEDIAAANGFSSVDEFNSSIKDQDQEDDYDYENSCFLVPCLECGKAKVREDEIYCSDCFNRLDEEDYFDPRL